MKKIYGLAVLLFISSMLFAQTYPVTFDNLNLPAQDSVWKGKDQSGGFVSNGMVFRNTFDSTYDFWTGAAYSKVKDKSTEGFNNQFASYTGGGINKTSQYAVLTGKAKIVLENRAKIKGMYIANSTYVALSMKNGDAFAKKFGGTTGNDKDIFTLKAYGMTNGIVVDSMKLNLADYGFSDNSKDYILDDWTWFDLSKWPAIDSLYFDYESSDTGKYGINTPQYFCVDDINGAAPSTIVTQENFESLVLDSTGVWNGNAGTGGFLLSEMYFENSYNADWQSWSGWAVSNHTDTVTSGFENQYSVIAGKGANKSNIYLVGYENTVIRLPYNEGLATTGDGVGIMVNNSTYTYQSMKNGDAFSKQFGGTSGNDPDYFKLLIKGFDKRGNYVDSVEFYLADFRFNNNTDDYIVKDWTLVDISKLVLNRAVRLEFSLSSSDNGTFGMNTPAFFCVDEVMNFISGKVVNKSIETIQVYPNPTQHLLNIKMQGMATINVYDLSGKHIANFEYDGLHSIDVSDLKSGIYVIGMEQDGKVYRSKFVKQ